MTPSVQDQRPTDSGASQPGGGVSIRRIVVVAATVAVTVVLFAVFAACQQPRELAEPYEIRIDEGDLQGGITVEETTFQGTRVRGELVAVPAGFYEAYFSSDTCQTRGKRLTGFGVRNVEDVGFTLEDHDLPFSAVATGEHYLGIESTSSAEGRLQACVRLAP